MAEQIQATVDDVVYTEEMVVSCNGPKFSRHPKVYLTITDGATQEVVCPYCSRVFRRKTRNTHN